MARATVQVMILGCPPGHIRTVLGILAEHSLRPPLIEEFTEPGELDPTSTLILAAPYRAEAKPSGTAADIASQLTAKTPVVAYQVWEHPTGGQMGTLVAHVPGLNRITGDCNAAGDLLITSGELLSTMGATTVDLLGFGLPVMRVIKTLVAQGVTILCAPREGGSDA